MNAPLRSAIEDVYAAFADVPRPAAIEACPCCMDDEEIRILLAGNLRELSPAELSSYASKVLLTVGDVPDFLYLAPRILEIAATDDGWWPSPEVVTQKLRAAGFASWPEPRRQAVARYLDAVFDEARAQNDGGFRLDGWICALGLLFDDVGPYLDRLARDRHALLRYHEHNREGLTRGTLENAFWDEGLPAYRQVLHWLKSPEIQDIIRKSYGP